MLKSKIVMIDDGKVYTLKPTDKSKGSPAQEHALEPARKTATLKHLND